MRANCSTECPGPNVDVERTSAPSRIGTVIAAPRTNTASTRGYHSDLFVKVDPHGEGVGVGDPLRGAKREFPVGEQRPVQ